MEIPWRLMSVYTSTWRCVFIQGGKEKQSKKLRASVSRENWACNAFWGSLHVYLWFSAMSNVLTRDYFISQGTAWPLSPPLIVGVRSHGGAELCFALPWRVCAGMESGRLKKKEKNPAKKMNSLALSVAVECLTLAVGLWVLGLAAPGMGGMAGGWAQAVSPVNLYIPTSFSTSATAHPKALHWSVHTFIKKSLCIFYTSFPPDLNVLMNISYIQLNFSSVFGCREWNLYYYLHILLLFAYLYLHLWLYY